MINSLFYADENDWGEWSSLVSVCLIWSVCENCSLLAGKTLEAEWDRLRDTNYLMM